MKGRGRARGGELVAMLCGSVRGQHGQEHGAQPGRRIVAGEIIQCWRVRPRRAKLWSRRTGQEEQELQKRLCVPGRLC